MLNDYDFTDIQIDLLLRNMQALQTDFLQDVIAYLKTLESSQLADRKLLRRLLLERMSMARRGVFDNAVLSSVNSILSHEFNIVNNRIMKAFANGLLPSYTLDDKKAFDAGLKLIYDKTKAISDKMLSVKNEQVISSLGRSARGLKSGTISVQDAVKKMAVSVANDTWRVPVQTQSGVQQWDASALTTRQIRNDAKNITLDRTNKVIARNNVNLVEVSSHASSRPDHAEWQGEVFWVHTPVAGYRSWEVVGEGYPDGFGGVNCRHRKTPFFPEIDEPPKEIEYDKDLYERTQELRRLEHHRRQIEQQRTVLDSAGVPNDLSDRSKDLEDRINRLATENNLTARA